MHMVPHLSVGIIIIIIIIRNVTKSFKWEKTNRYLAHTD